MTPEEFDQIRCTCGSQSAGMVFIHDEGRYQCGECIQIAYADLKSTAANLKDATRTIIRSVEKVADINRQLEHVTQSINTAKILGLTGNSLLQCLEEFEDGKTVHEQ